MLRIKVVSSIIIFFFLFLFFNLFNTVIIKGRSFKESSNKNCIRLLPQAGSRGRILDRQGKTIVNDELSYDLMIMPQQDVKQIDEILRRVSAVLGTSLGDLKNAFKNNFVAAFAPIVIAKNIDIKKAIALEELRPELDGVIIQPRPQRAYPYGRLACHIIGYLNEIDRWRLTKLSDYGYKTKDIVGFGGVEEKYDYYLRQEEGGLSIEVDHRGRFIRTLGFKPPKSGKDIQLSIDLRIQKIVENNLAGRNGCVIIMAPYSGEIIAMASQPNFNPGIFVKESDPSAMRNLLNNPDAPLINRAMSGVYPAGSVFKIILATAALETGKVNLSKTFFCSGSMHIGRQEFSCWDTHHEQNLISAIIHSCNIFFYRTGLLLGAQAIHDYAVKFGFSRISSIDLPYEASGFVPYPLWKKIYRFKNWLDGDTANLSIGQGDLLVTPLQITRMMAVFANRGKLLTPYIVKAVGGQDTSIYKRKILLLPIRASTIDHVREGLRGVASGPAGTASFLSSLPVSVAGKTGTAQAPPGQPHGWFAGFFPFENPKFVICVLLERGGAGYYAAVLAKQVIETMFQEGLI